VKIKWTSKDNSERRNFEQEQFSAKGVNFQLNSEKCVQYKPLKRNGKNVKISRSIQKDLGRPFGAISSVQMVLCCLRKKALSTSIHMITSGNSIKDFMIKIKKGLNLGHFDPFLGRNTGTGILLNMWFAAKWAPYRSLFACRKPKKLLGYFWRKIEKGPNLGHFDPFLGRNPGTGILLNMWFAAKWAPYRSLFACRKPKKLLGYFWRKIEKGPNLGHFDPFLGRNPGTRFFFKNQALSLLSFYQYLTSCEVSRKSLEPFSRKTHN